MKKILIVDPGDFIGGAELFAIETMNQMAKSNDHEIHVVTNGHRPYTSKLDTSIRVHKAHIGRLKILNPKAIFSLFTAVKSIKNIIDSENISLVVSNSIRAHIVSSLALMFSHTKKLAWIVHDFTFPHFFLRIFSRFPDTIFYISDAVKKDLKKKMRKCDRHKLSYLPNGFDVKAIRRGRNGAHLDLRKQFKIGKDAQLIGMVGRIDWWKGQKEFVKAALMHIEKENDFHFFIFGDANTHDKATLIYKKEVLSLLKNNAAKERIHFMGHQSDIYGLISQLNLLVHTSIVPEPFGRVVAEGMALEIPVLASKLGGPSELIDHGVDGFLWNSPDYTDLFHCTEKILSTSEEKRRNIALSGFKKISRDFSLARTAEILASL